MTSYYCAVCTYVSYHFQCFYHYWFILDSNLHLYKHVSVEVPQDLIIIDTIKHVWDTLFKMMSVEQWKITAAQYKYFFAILIDCTALETNTFFFSKNIAYF